MSNEDVVQAKVTFHHDGGMVRAGAIVRVGHELLKRFPDMFGPLVVDHDLEEPVSKPVGRHAPKPADK